MREREESCSRIVRPEALLKRPLECRADYGPSVSVLNIAFSTHSVVNKRAYKLN